jgi:hypothetical protein
MVAVIAAMGGEVEGDGEALLPGRQIAAIEGVRFLGGREAGILADGPGLLDVHGRIRPAQERRKAGHGVQKVEPPERGLVIDRRQLDSLRRHPAIAIGSACLARLGQRPFHLAKIG